MSTSPPAGDHGSEAAVGTGAYVSLSAVSVPAPARKEQSPVVVTAALTALSVLLVAAISIPLYLFSSSSSTLPSPHQLYHQVPPNTTQYGSYPMLYLDPRNRWTPSDRFLFNQSTVDIDLNKVPLSRYKGNITLVTNVASF